MKQLRSILNRFAPILTVVLLFSQTARPASTLIDSDYRSSISGSVLFENSEADSTVYRSRPKGPLQETLFAPSELLFHSAQPPIPEFHGCSRISGVLRKTTSSFHLPLRI